MIKVKKEIIKLSELAFARYFMDSPIVCSSSGLEILPLGYDEENYRDNATKIFKISSYKIESEWAIRHLFTSYIRKECVSFHYFDSINKNIFYDQDCCNYEIILNKYGTFYLRFCTNNNDNSLVCLRLGEINLKNNFLDTAKYWFQLGIEISYKYRDLFPKVIVDSTFTQHNKCKEKYYPECLEGLGEYYCKISDKEKALMVFKELKKLKNDKDMISVYMEVLNNKNYI